MSFSRRLLAPATSLLIAAVATTFSSACKDKPAENAVDAAASTPPAGSTATPMASAPTPATSASSATGDREGRAGLHGGPGAMLFQAARALELKDDQKAKIDAAEKTAHAAADEASREAMKTAVNDLHTDLVSGIKAGKIDTAKLEPRYAAIERSVATAHEKDAAALVALHDALDATQRKAVTANVRAALAAREEKMAHREGPDGGAAGAGAADGGKGPSGAKRNVDRLTRGLDLDADQQKKIDAVAAKDDTAKGGRPDIAELKKNVESLLVAFEKDTFDPKKLDAFDAKKARAPMEHETKLLVQVIPILKPEQREKLATTMNRGPSPHGRRTGFGHRPQLEEQDDGE